MHCYMIHAKVTYWFAGEARHILKPTFDWKRAQQNHEDAEKRGIAHVCTSINFESNLSEKQRKQNPP